MVGFCDGACTMPMVPQSTADWGGGDLKKSLNLNSLMAGKVHS
jgi:hypothetical protein